MKLDKKLVDQLIKVTSFASIACHKYIGKGDKLLADKAATDSMRKNLNKLDAAIFERNFREIGKELGLYKLDQKVQYRKYKCSCGKYEGKKIIDSKTI